LGHVGNLLKKKQELEEGWGGVAEDEVDGEECAGRFRRRAIH